jgi:tetratricopeptide (TPR) repeat protein
MPAPAVEAPQTGRRGRFSCRAVGGVATILCVLAIPAARAQSPAQRNQIEAFRDSIGAVKDTASLLAFEKRLIVRASGPMRDSAMVHLHLGFLALRLGDLNGKKHYEDAASEFQWVVDLQPKWPYGWFGLGFAELGVGDAEFAMLRGLQTALGKDALTRSANDFARSAEVDPGFVRGLVELASTAIRQRINLRMDVALAALRRAARTPAAAHPDVLLARARIEREIGSPDSALAAIDSLIKRAPANPQALLEQARVRFRLGRRDGTDPWFRGLTLADAPTVALYRSDLLFVMPDSTLRAFDASSDDQRVALMRRFWDYRDRDELHSPGERLVEHYRRIDYARRVYRLASTHRHYDIVERYRPPVAEFDDRGVIYIRQGAPDDRASLELPGLPYNESWVYHRGGQPDLLFHFVAREGVTDFRLVESALDVLGYSTALRLQGSGNVQGADAPLMAGSHTRPANISRDSAAVLRQRLDDASASRTAEALIRSRERLNPVYGRLLGSGKGSATGLQGEERAIGRRSIRIGTTTDSWPRSYAIGLPAQAQLLATVGDSASPMVRVAYAIPVSTLPAGLRSATTIAPHLRIAVIGLDGIVATVIDTTVIATRAAPRGMPEQFLGVIPVRVPAGRYTARVGFELDHAGVVSQRDTVDVPSATGPRLALSDIVIGAANVPLSWIGAPGDTVTVNPVAVYRSSESMQLYFEVGATRDSSYHVELVIRRPGAKSLLQRITGLFGASGDAMRLGFDQRPRSATDLVHRELALQKLKPARYVLEVTVSRPGGDKVTRRQEFSVVR